MLRSSYKLFKLATSHNKRPIIVNFIAAFILECCSVYMLYLLNAEYGHLYKAIQNYDTDGIWGSITTFTWMAMVLVGVNGYLGYYIARLAFEVRTGLTNYFFTWANKPEVPNIDQRIQEDFKRFGESACEFWFAVLKAGIYLPVFLGVVINLTKWYVGATIFGAVVLGTWLTKVVANRLIKEQSIQEGNEADFRQSLGTMDYLKITLKFYQINRLFKYLSFTQAGLSQTFALLPFIVLMPLYISKAIALGAFFQAVNALGKVIDSLSILIDSRQVIVQIETCIARLGFLIQDK